MQYLLDKPLIVGQFIDTLVTGHKCNDDEHYYVKFLDIVDKLKEYKELAKTLPVFGEKFIVVDNFLELGKFKVFSTGLRQYAYRLSNENIDIFVTASEFGDSKPQLKIEYRSKFLFELGYKKAFEFGNIVASRFLGSDFYSQVLRIDLASDIWGVNFDFYDSARFRTPLAIARYSSDFMRFNRVEGFQFGKGDFLVRVYDKTLEIGQKSQKTYFEDFWALNGYDKSLGFNVWRFEVQLRRAKLKSLFPKKLKNEVEFIFSNLEQLWIKFLKGFKFVNVTLPEIERINKFMSVGNFESARRIYQRRYEKQLEPLDELLQLWDNKKLNIGMLVEYKNYDNSNMIYLQRFIKGAISQSFSLSGSFSAFVTSLENIQQELELEHSSIVEYGLSKSFSKCKDIYRALENGKLRNYEASLITSNKNALFRFSKDFVNLMQVLKSESKEVRLFDDYHNYYSRVNSLIDSNVDFIIKQDIDDSCIVYDGGFSTTESFEIDLPF